MKKLLSIMLSIIMIVTSVPFAFAAYETPPTRIIDGKTYYELDSADDLYWFAEQVNVNENDTINAILTANIVINENLMSKITVAEDGTATINEGETVREWTPIKYFINSDMVGYKGIFDGSNHTISGLYGNSDDMHYMGFFALANGATIKNLGIIDSYFYEYRNVASVVALARNTTIINCFSENCLIANEAQRAGGIAGRLDDSNIIGCYNASTIRESGGGYYIGGIVGESVSTTISDCFNTGSIVATGDKVGGIVGCINSSSAVVENCYNIGKINSDSEKTGGIAGENWGSVIDCYFNSEIFSGSAIGINKGSAVSSEGKTALQFASGEVAYAFGSAWGQKLGTDPYPVLGSTDTVYRVATYTKCDMSDVPVCEYNNTSGSDINNAPQHVLTGEITCMGKLCEVCGKYYGDADESKHLLSWKTAKEATCAEPGLEIYNCEVCGNAPAMETVLCDSATYPESEHNYPSQANEEYAFSYPGATKLVITFSEDTETEENYDFIYIYDSTGTEYGKYSGTELAGVQIDLEGGSFKIKLTSDGSGNRYGFRLASVYATAPTAEYQIEIPALGHNWSNKDGICAKEDCGYECPHESITDNKCDNCGAEGTFVTIDMTDSYGDGWSGNAVVIKQFVDGVFTEAGTATIENGGSGTFTTVLPKDGIFALSWLTGEYSYECGFTIAVDGETVYECTDGGTLTDGQMIYVICEHTSYTNGKCDVCGYECTHESYTDSKCDACGYICTHEGQNGSCEICGANLGKLVIDVTDKSSVKIGTGREYYDEDGYIITGTNQNTDVYIYESADLTLKNAVFSRLFIQYAPEDSVINITLDGTTEVELVDVYKAHLIFDGGETDTLKTPSFNTGGNPGSVTVNGGNIILDCVTESTLPTIICAGGFIINGGTVTASNNYYNVVFDSVTLNGGELNIISTSTYYEAIMGSIIIEKGALLTVSATKGILDVDSDIVMADDAEENDYFFVRYDTESEFVPVQDIEAALDGKTYAEIKIDTHEHSYTDGICDCGYVCLHVNFADGICPDCTASGKLVAIKISDSNNDGWYGKNAVVIKQLVDGAFEEVETATLTDGKSGTVAVNLDKDGTYVITWQSDYYPNECGFEIYVDGECVYSISDARGIENNAILYTICEHTGGKADCLHRAVCEKCGNEYGEVDADGHDWSNKDGICANCCGETCPHSSYTDSKCDACGYICTHEGQNGSCQVCGANLGKLVIDVTDKADVSIGNGQTYYDEDGYIITGTNKDLIVYVYEEGNFVFRNASFKSFWLNGGDYEVTITLEGDNYLGATEDYYYGISFSYHHLTIEGGENDTLNFNCKASAIDTGGRPGTCIVNGGKINAVTETDQNYSTLRSFGGFIMNGGEVTLSNNYCDVVGCPVTLNGGVLNVIGTSTDCAAVNQKITVEKGALLTVSSACGIFSDWYGTDIVVADDAEENTLLFAKYNTEDEFAPVYDIKSALDGKTYTEIKADTHNHSFTNDECVCGFVCEHTDREDGFCTVCKRYIYEITHQPTSGEPYVELNDDTDASYQWYEVERRGPEITEENADTVVYDWGESSYDKETGWTGVAYEENITGQDFFTVALKAGETVIVELTGDFTEGVGLWDYNTNYGVLIEAEEGVSSYEITVGADGDYTFYTFVNSGVVTVKAYTGVTNYTAIEGEASAEIKNPEIGKRYVCEVTYGNGTTEMTDVLKYSYAITHQPTSEEPYVELSDDTDASYQWYTVEDDAEEITDENAKASAGTYSAEYGWSPMIEASSSTQYYFSFDLKAGDKVTFEFSSVPEIIKFSDFIVRPEETTFSYVADLDRNCELIAHYDGTEITARAYLGDATYTAIEGENSAELKNADIGKNYACEVTFADGTTEMSDTFEVTNLHECDFTGEWKYDADKHWKECTCGETGEEAEHTYTDGKCECGYECPHESYTDGVCDVCNYLCPHSFTEFTETVAPKCEEPGWEESYCDYCNLKLEQEIPALDHDWVSGGIERPYQNIDGSWTDGYYYDSCKNDGTHIKITGVAKRADYSAYDEAYKSLKAAQKNANLTDAGAAAVNQAVMTGMTMPQNIVEGENTTAYLNNWVKNAQSILAKIENGEYLKADYTEIDEAIASVDTALENASISDEMTEELEDIKADLEALKENENATMADVNALLDRTEAIAETMNNCANGVHSFTKYEEVTAPKCGVAGKEAAICDNGCGATDEREIPALTHSFTKYEEVTAPKCGVAGKEAAICDNGCGVTDEKEIPALSHKDADGDYKCDYGCGHEFEKPAEPEDPSANCDHLCHSNNWFVKNIIWKIVQFFWKLFKMNPVCECGAAHY